MKKLSTVFGCLMLLAACAGAPQPTGPIVTSGPLQGRINDWVFQDMRDWFAIIIPFREGNDADHRALVEEIYKPSISFVGFTSAASPGEVYRVYAEDLFASNHPVPDMDRLSDAVLQSYGKQLVAARTTPLIFQQEKSWRVGDNQGLLRLYTQKVPTELLALDLMRGRGLAEDYTAYILMYVTAKNGKAVALWAEWPEDCTVCGPIPAGPAAKVGADAIDRALSADVRAKAFLDSFSYSAGAAAYQ